MAMANPHKRGMFEEPTPEAKRLCVANPEYQLAFNQFDTDRNGCIDIGELNNALQAVERSVESPSAGALRLFPHTFQAKTVFWLASRFGASGGGVIHYREFAEMMQYLESVRNIFKQMDLNASGDLDVSELSRALQLSGFNVTGFPGGGDALSLAVAEEIGRAYDADGNGVLTFDEFVQLRLEWDTYIDAWGGNVPPGANAIAPQQLLAVLEAVKKSLEPLNAAAQLPWGSFACGFDPRAYIGGMMFSSMFTAQRPFDVRTAELLIRRFGNGNAMLTFEQFCRMMEWLKVQKRKFALADLDRDGHIDLKELATAFAQSGLPMAMDSLVAIARRYDSRATGALEFDEFLQMVAENNL